MQDRFKFRVWQIVRTKGKDILVFMEFLECSAINLNNYIHRSDCIIEQCTGLKDKNGKLIYEGDIVETHDYTTEHSQIVFDKGCYVLKSKDAAMYEHLSNYEKECEVIGNIHENPELLEEDK